MQRNPSSRRPPVQQRMPQQPRTVVQPPRRRSSVTVGPMAPTPEVPPAAWRETIEANLTSGFLAAQHQIPAMLRRGGGSLIFTSTFVGYTAGFPGAASYAASKSGLIGLTQSLASEFGPRASASTPYCQAARTRLWPKPGSARPKQRRLSRASTL